MKKTYLHEGLTYSLFLVIALFVIKTNGDKFESLDFKYGNTINIRLGTYSNPVDCSHFKLSYRTENSSTRNYIEFDFGGTLTGTNVQDALKDDDSAIKCRRKCRDQNDCYSSTWKNGLCKNYKQDAHSYPTRIIPASSLPELVKFSRVLNGITENIFSIRMDFNIGYDILYEFDFNIPYNNVTFTHSESIRLSLMQFTCNGSAMAFDSFYCTVIMLRDPPSGNNHHVSLTIGTSPPTSINATWNKRDNSYQFTTDIETVGLYSLTARNLDYNSTATRWINITSVVGFSYGQTKKLVTAIFDNPNSSDPIASLGDANPQLLLNILALPGQDMGGCLSNCSNKGKCKMNEQNKFVCLCQQYYRGSSCEIDIRGCTPKPCQNNGTCTEVIIPGQEDQGFTCNCSSPVYFGIRCEQKINVCWNKTCSYSGKCYDNATIPTCKCFKYFSGGDCEIKSDELKAMKQTAAVASVLAITMVTAFYLSIFVGDYFSLVHASVVAVFA